jgi:hypothetical protein
MTETTKNRKRVSYLLDFETHERRKKAHALAEKNGRSLAQQLRYMIDKEHDRELCCCFEHVGDNDHCPVHGPSTASFASAKPSAQDKPSILTKHANIAALEEGQE